MQSLVRALIRLDRRWIFLAMGVSVLIPILLKWRFREITTPIVQTAFDMVENLPEGSRILMAYDFDASSAPELEPMATAWLWHCAKKKHKMYILTLWATGDGYVPGVYKKVFADFPALREGHDYVYLGYKAGNEAVIRTCTNDLRSIFSTDSAGTAVSQIPMMEGITSVRDFDLIVNTSAGYPGTKEWVQYASTPLRVPIIAGNTGVQAATMFPYYPDQLPGLLAAIKGAAEYEAAVMKKYPEYGEKDGQPRKEFTEGIKKMGPQLLAHCLILLLIILGNVILFLQSRYREAVR